MARRPSPRKPGSKTGSKLGGKPATAAPAAPAPREVELKLRLRPEDVAALRARLDALGPAQASRVDNIYYDTPDLRLAAARTALRLRCIRRGRRRLWVQTFKTEDRDAALAVRGEWETPAPRGRLDLARLGAAPLAALLGDAAAALAPRFRTLFERTAWDLEWGGARIEAALDEGWIEAGGRSEAILELELELRAGSPVALFDLALRLCGAEAAVARRAAAAPAPGARRRPRAAADLSLLPYGASKAARGVRLAVGEATLVPVPGLPKRRAAPSTPPVAAALLPGLSLGEAARRWLGLGLDPLLANALGASASAHPEFVHQARIALRLMRVGAELLARGGTGIDLPPAQLRALQVWARRFGAVREWDVLCTDVLPALRRAAGKGGSAAWERVEQAARRRGERARARLQQRLRAPEFAEFALRLLRWCAGATPGGGQRLDDYAHKALRQRQRRLAKAARGFAGASMQRQHKIRLQAKSLRYAFEALRGVAPDALRQSDLRTLSRFQDTAGRARDLSLARAALLGLTRSKSLRRQIDAWTREQKRVGLEKARRLALILREG
jgi:inorganic triphosphatase YgiF